MSSLRSRGVRRQGGERPLHQFTLARLSRCRGHKLTSIIPHRRSWCSGDRGPPILRFAGPSASENRGVISYSPTPGPAWGPKQGVQLSWLRHNTSWKMRPTPTSAAPPWQGPVSRKPWVAEMPWTTTPWRQQGAISHHEDTPCTMVDAHGSVPQNPSGEPSHFSCISQDDLEAPCITTARGIPYPRPWGGLPGRGALRHPWWMSRPGGSALLSQSGSTTYRCPHLQCT